MADRPRIAITGGFGFLGWHVACRLRARHGADPVRLGRDVLANPRRLDEALNDVAGVLHLAGVNRGATAEDVRMGNLTAAQALAAALDRRSGLLPLVYANSIQAVSDSPYGTSKATAADILASAPSSSLANVLLPNLFGEHGRPRYNSFVATFADAVSRGEEPEVLHDREVPLLHAQAAAAVLIESLLDGRDGTIEPAGERRRVSDILALLREMHAAYRDGELPPLAGAFETDLFNTYRSFRFPAAFPIEPDVHSDERGDLVETVRLHGGRGQGFASTTRPGHERGNHYHLRKFERFFVLKGRAEIRLRRLLHDEVITFRLAETRPAFVDMPTLWTHSLRNVGDEELVTLFWSDQLLDLADPDQYPERVLPEAAS